MAAAGALNRKCNWITGVPESKYSLWFCYRCLSFVDIFVFIFCSCPVSFSSDNTVQPVSAPSYGSAMMTLTDAHIDIDRQRYRWRSTVTSAMLASPSHSVSCLLQ